MSGMEWVKFADLEDVGKAKVLGLKILIKALLATANDPVLDIASAKSVMKICRTLLQKEGELLSDESTPMAFKTHLRLQAGLGFLKMATFVALEPLFEPTDFNTLALLMQDPVYHLRNTFVEKMCAALSGRKIAPKFAMGLMLSAQEPEEVLKSKVAGFLIKTAKVMRNEGTFCDDVDPSKKKVLLEHHFPEFCHLLSHHPDFSTVKSELKTFELYVTFFLDTIATSENISYLYALASQMKTVKDRFMEDSTPLYMIAEMQILMIQSYCVHHNWTLQTYPGKLSIPRDLYLRLDDDRVSEVLRTVYYKDGENLAKPKKILKRVVEKVDREGNHSDWDSGSEDENLSPKKQRVGLVEPRRSARTRKGTGSSVEIESL